MIKEALASRAPFTCGLKIPDLRANESRRGAFGQVGRARRQLLKLLALCSTEETEQTRHQVESCTVSLLL